MKPLSFFRAAVAVSLISLLAACGGGGGTDANGKTPLVAAPEVSWGSPAMFVTPGASSKTLAANGCTFQVGLGAQEKMHSVTMVITSAGDVSLVGSTAQGATPTTQLELKFAEMSYSGIDIRGTAQSPIYKLNMIKTKKGDSLELGNSKSQLLANKSSLDTTFACATVDSPSLQILLDSARVAKNLGKEAGATTYNSNRFKGRIEGDFAHWLIEAQQLGGNSTNYRANLVSGELAIQTSTSGTPTFAAISAQLPTVLPEMAVAFYNEGVCRNNTLAYDSKEAKTLTVQNVRKDNSSPPLAITRFGNQLMPHPSYPAESVCFDQKK